MPFDIKAVENSPKIGHNSRTGSARSQCKRLNAGLFDYKRYTYSGKSCASYF